MKDILFPSDFEEAYNRLHERPNYVGGNSDEATYPIFDSNKHRSAVREEEREVAYRKALVPKKKDTTRAVGGDIQDPKARKLLPKLLKKRAEDYRALDAMEAPPPTAPTSAMPYAESAPEAVARELDSKLQSLLTIVSVGNISKDTLELSGQIMAMLNAKGDILTENQLTKLYEYLPTINDYLTRRLRMKDVEEDAKGKREILRNAQVTSLMVNVIGRQFRAILSKVNAPAKSRSLFQREVRRASSEFLQKKIKELAPTGAPGRPRTPGVLPFARESPF